jgi:hypothetical protein
MCRKLHSRLPGRKEEELAIVTMNMMTFARRELAKMPADAKATIRGSRIFRLIEREE